MISECQLKYKVIYQTWCKFCNNKKETLHYEEYIENRPIISMQNSGILLSRLIKKSTIILSIRKEIISFRETKSQLSNCFVIIPFVYGGKLSNYHTLCGTKLAFTEHFQTPVFLVLLWATLHNKPHLRLSFVASKWNITPFLSFSESEVVISRRHNINAHACIRHFDNLWLEISPQCERTSKDNLESDI